MSPPSLGGCMNEMQKKFKVTEKQLDKWKIIGKQFGYPQCCIDAFVKLEHIGCERKLTGTGYIPCIECDKKTEEELIMIINANRTHSTLFPIENRQEIKAIWED